jgi:sulfur-oxidizing protein SoxX
MQHRGVGWGACACIALLTVAWALNTTRSGRSSQIASAAAPEQPKAPIRVSAEELHQHGKFGVAREQARKAIRVSAEELHQHGGIPPGWQFSLPPGDPGAGRAVFEKLECFQCHAVHGGGFPEPSPPDGKSAPDLTGVGDHHPIGYLAESILYPNAVIVMGPGHTGDDGLSIMPDYRESLSVAELIDLVAYLKSLEGDESHEEAEHHTHHAASKPLFDQVVGDYRIRLDYNAGGTTGPEHRGHGHGEHGKTGAQAKATSQLMAFIADAKTGQSVPYLPVSATVTSAKAPARQVKLQPMLGDMGLYYGAAVTLPSSPATITLSIGVPDIRVMPSAAGRFSTPQQASLDWIPPSAPRTGEGGRSAPPQSHQHPARGKAR